MNLKKLPTTQVYKQIHGSLYTILADPSQANEKVAAENIITTGKLRFFVKDR